MILIESLILFFFYQKLKNFIKNRPYFFSLVIFSSKKEIIKTYLFLFIIVFFYVFIFRILRLWLNNNMYLNLNLFFYYFHKSFIFFGIYNTLTYIIFLFLFFFEFQKIFKYYVKLKFLKFYYYNYNFFYFFLENLNIFDKKISSFFYTFDKNYIIFYYLMRDFFFKFLIIILAIKDLFFNSGIIYIGLLKYYFLYSTILIFYKFLLKFVSDFDFGIIMLYNPKIVSLTQLGLIKLDLYIKYLIKGNSNILFLNSNFFENFNQKISDNVVFFFIFPSSFKNAIFLKFKR